VVFTEGPLLLERDPIEETKPRDSNLYRARSQLPLVCQIDLVGADVFGLQFVRRFTEVAREL
jgi:hypothetical protein